MQTDQLFYWVMADLDACIRSPMHYHRLRIAGLLRLLLFDEHPLWAQVNRERRLRLEFRVGGYLREVRPGDPLYAMMASATEFVEDGIDPHLFGVPIPDAETVDLKRLLALPIVRLDGTLLSVREFLQHMAYVRGVTHAGAAQDEAHSALLNWRLYMRLMGVPAGLATLRALGKVVYAGLLPLLEVVNSERCSGQPLAKFFEYDLIDLPPGHNREEPPLPSVPAKSGPAQVASLTDSPEAGAG